MPKIYRSDPGGDNSANNPDMSPASDLDPGELLLAVEERVRRATFEIVECATPDIRAVRDALKVAVVDLDRLVALIPPGEAAVPVAALTSVIARDVSEREPARFARSTLEALRQQLKKSVHAMTSELGDRADPAFVARTKATADALLTGINETEDPVHRMLTSEFPILRAQLSVTFRATDDARYPYAADIDGKRWTVRINEFPESPSLYSLFIGGQIVEELMDWPVAWTRPDRTHATEQQNL